MMRCEADVFVLKAGASDKFLKCLELVHLPAGIIEVLVEQYDGPRNNAVTKLGEVPPISTGQSA